MVSSLFEDVVTLYEKSSSPTITRHRIQYPTLGKFCVSLNSFYPILGDLTSDEYWQKFLFPLKRLQFELCAAPYSEESRLERISTVVKELRYHLRFCSKLYPDLADQAFTILYLLVKLLDESKDPLLDKLLDLTGAEQKVTWVIKESRLIPHVEKLVTGLHLPKLSFIHPLQLKDLTCYDQIIVIGPSRWFPESIFTAARSSQVHILIFDWIRDRWNPEKIFVNPHQSTGPANRKYITVEERETGNHWDNIDAENLLAVIDNDSSVVSTLDKRERDEYEDVEAICVFLEGDWAVFIDASEGTKALIIDPDEDPDNRIIRVLVKDIQPGIFILVRTSGAGDYIVPVADNLMGNLAEQARRYQKHWKQLLRSYVKARDLFRTSIALLDCGSNIANEQNVRNWMSPRSIRTQNYHDFLAIMKLVGLEDKAEDYWDMMGRINQAHIKAGSEIRNLLLDQVKDLDIEELQKRGKMDFKLSGNDVGGLTAFRVERVLQKVIEVPYSRIGHPFKLEN